MSERLDYKASCQKLNLDPIPPIPDRRPSYNDDEPLGFSFFRELVEGDYSNLTLPRTFFGRSEIREATFFNTDLKESTLCWNDFMEVDFGKAILSHSDLRAALFENVSFANCDLSFSDLRRSSFINCNFEGANLKGAVLTKEMGKALTFSPSQRSQITWVDDDGPEPEGG